MLFQDGRREKAHFTLIALAVQLAALLLHIPAVFAQDPKKLPPEIAAELARSPKPPLSNKLSASTSIDFSATPFCLRFVSPRA